MDYLELAKCFEEKISSGYYHQNNEVLHIKNKIESILNSDTKQLLFLTGQPGVGKSAFLDYLNTQFSYDVIKFDIPFLEPIDFVKILIKKTGTEVHNYSLEELIKQVISLYKDSNYVIVLDEAQLLSKDMIEIIRILADSKAFWFILAMHEHESKKILQEPQFASRPHKVLQLQNISLQECKEYIYAELENQNATLLANNITNKYIKYIYKLTRGNMRMLKKLLYTSFLLIDYAQKNNEDKYNTFNKCIVIMAAIDTGLINA
ncbi:AAA family ATPase [Sulfurimonas sp.]